MHFKLFSTFFLLFILFNEPFSSNAFFSEFFQNIKNGLIGGENENKNENIIEDNIDNSNQQNNKLENKNEIKDNTLPGSYFNLKFKHFGLGGPNNNLFNGNNLKSGINEKEITDNQFNENNNKLEEKEENEEEEERLFNRVVNWFKQNTEEILAKGKEFFTINKKNDKKLEEGEEKMN
ncbi:hypothetical protein Mgra_00008264 [Meloidogyne graminicola]|uniref:Uncharacterized protein n=1 Tax=Meloidogyne graminicola TaxID=189291 RepID=A0A8S9ZGG1_9BILA|nr:hypothetical protein Mgra_00008264 [Meloidogyne graminicola]